MTKLVFSHIISAGTNKFICANEGDVTGTTVMKRITNSGADLANVDFSGADLRMANLSGTFLTGIDLSNANNIAGLILIGATGIKGDEEDLKNRGAIVNVQQLEELVEEMRNYNGQKIDPKKALQYLSILSNSTELNFLVKEDVGSLNKKFALLGDAKRITEILSTKAMPLNNERSGLKKQSHQATQGENILKSATLIEEDLSTGILFEKQSDGDISLLERQLFESAGCLGFKTNDWGIFNKEQLIEVLQEAYLILEEKHEDHEAKQLEFSNKLMEAGILSHEDFPEICSRVDHLQYAFNIRLFNKDKSINELSLISKAQYLIDQDSASKDLFRIIPAQEAGDLRPTLEVTPRGIKLIAFIQRSSQLGDTQHEMVRYLIRSAK
jgi:uncharacterized protein YjbI with pentapeptide repeats